jgi:hypothetical protein
MTLYQLFQFIRKNGRLIMNDQLARKWLWSILGYYPSISFRRLAESEENISEYTWPPD